ncbi:MAG: hypothetical protein NT085_02340, partial [candidate division SR1 bacterium]|nr:hypothetical protein [candidate division SR1 bacterium]
EADIIISGTGQGGLITGDKIKKGVVIIDAGTSKMDGKIVGDVDRKSLMYLWNKLSDPNVHPNDYLQFEAPSEFIFTHVLTTCKGAYMLSNLVSGIDDNDNQAIEKGYQEEAAETRTVEADDEFELMKKENHIPDLPEDEVVVDEIMEVEQPENLFDMKIKDGFKLFQRCFCEKRKDSLCAKRHYLIGTGSVMINNETYTGTHVYLYPDVNYEETDIAEEDIKDPLYLAFQTQKDTPGIQYARSRYVCGYVKEFRELLSQM